jgi:hypothetical protein
MLRDLCDDVVKAGEIGDLKELEKATVRFLAFCNRLQKTK